MQQITFQIKQDVESGGYFAESHILENEQIITEGDSFLELETNIKDALNCHFNNPNEIKYELVSN
ncbi:hypothetical protein [Lacihabitans soyangensis]|uniref:2-oxoisovalerate dehydrogenase n=1 Tax=Lacihabitans soyangensis TaxID=869394 RepID=A0AAE3GY64_9BACT|nr:hypothetical protein [Lacihabitans soyangensis]MCP9761449.1 hypothetical protein [Lacihabitans soyangensis]